MPRTGVSILCGAAYFEIENLGWCLFVEKLASEGDLEENHHLEEIGKTIWTTAIEIKYCPYCGVELHDARSRSSPDEFGYFVHIDSSAWLSRRR